MLKRSNWAYLNGFSTTSPRKVSSSTFKRGFSTTSPRKMLDVGTIANPEVIVNTPLVIAAAITGWNVGCGVVLLALSVAMNIATDSADILNVEYFPSMPDPFDHDIPEHLLEEMDRAYADDADEWPSTPDMLDNLSTTPDRIDTLANTISHQLDYYLGYYRQFTEPLLNDGALQLRSGNFNLDPNSIEYIAIERLYGNLDYHEENLRFIVRRLQNIIDSIRAGSILWENHPELHANFHELCYIARTGVTELNDLISRSRQFRREIRDQLPVIRRRRP
jgi:hypothetical protein